jgi:tetratricopeptide (TPR) repeat protein
MPIWSAEIKELEKLYWSFKGQFPELEKELKQLIRTEDPNVMLLYSRRGLEVIITDLCECELKRERGSEPLKGIIDKLNKEKKIPAHIASSMYGLNELSTYGTHPKDFDPEQVKPVLVNLSIIIKWYLKYKGKDIKAPTEEEIKIRQEPTQEITNQLRTEPRTGSVRLIRDKLLSGIIIAAVLVFAAIITYPKIFKPNTLEKLRASAEKISVAVMPFQNMTNDTTFNVWQDGIQDNLINALANSEELKVRQTESISVFLNAKGISNLASIKKSLIRSISRNLNANVLISGSLKTAGNALRINTQMIDSKSNEVFKSFQIDGPSAKILNLIDSLSRVIRDFLIISKIQKEIPVDLHIKDLSKTSSPEAYRYFIYGQKAFLQRDNKTAVKMYERALEIDSNFTDAAVVLPFAYRNQGMVKEAKDLCLKIYKKRDLVGITSKIYIDWLYSVYFETPRESIKYMQQLLDLDDKAPIFYFFLCSNYNRLHQYVKAIPYGEKALEIYKDWGTNPTSVWFYTILGIAYHGAGQYLKEERLYNAGEKLFPGNPELSMRMAILYLSILDTTDAKSCIQKYIKICRENLMPETNIKSTLGHIYSEAGRPDEAEEYYQEALSLDPVNPVLMDQLAYFLIDSDRNVEGGMELVEKALALIPENELILETKGWGLFKEGKFREALIIMDKCDSLGPIYSYDNELHRESVKKAVAEQKNK